MTFFGRNMWPLKRTYLALVVFFVFTANIGTAISEITPTVNRVEHWIDFQSDLEVMAMSPDDERDMDGDTLVDWVENRIAQEFVPILAFDEDENALSTWMGEPITIFQVSPITCGMTEAYLPEYGPSSVVVITYQFLFHWDGGYASRGSDTNCYLFDDHRGDNTAIRLHLAYRDGRFTLIYLKNQTNDGGPNQYLCNFKSEDSGSICFVNRHRSYFYDSAVEGNSSYWDDSSGFAPGVMWTFPGWVDNHSVIFMAPGKHHTYQPRYEELHATWHSEAALHCKEKHDGQGAKVVPNLSPDGRWLNCGEYWTMPEADLFLHDEFIQP
jgi:hypothetical protein